MTLRTSLVLVLTVCLCVVLIHSCETGEAPVSLQEEEILSHIKEISGDAYLGRKPFTAGDKKTVEYLVSQCKALGLQPGNGDSYTQEVPMIETHSRPVGGRMQINTARGMREYQYGKDFVVNCPKTLDRVDLESAELVFCGYGINAPERGWNDFEGVDLKGKVAVVLVNDPGFGGEDSSFFKGDEMTYYGRWTYKYEEADRQGAKGLLIIHETHSAGYPWLVVQSSWSGPTLRLESEIIENGADLKGWIHLDMAKDLFSSCDLDLSEMIREARKPGFKAIPLNARLSCSVTNTFKRDVSNNVVALLPGNDSRDEYVLYSAHWDHLGVGRPSASGDSIYNGALDNASGSSIQLALAANFLKQKAKANRSLIFLWVTAEEQGLLGSEYYAKNPTVPVNQIVANINIDGCNPNGRMKDFQIVGIGHSEMDKIVGEELDKQGRYVLPDQEPEKGYFFRSDHFNFAKVGIPPIFGEGGYDHELNGIEYGKQKKAEYTAKNYHAPSDEYDPETWDMGGVLQDAQLYYNLGWRLANSGEWPQWNAGSEFKRHKSITD